MIFVIATIVLKPGQRDEFIAKANEAVIPTTRQEKGCISYDLTASSSDSNVAVFVERWESRGDLDAHLAAQHMADWRPVSGPMIESRTLEIIYPDNVETL